MNELRMLWPDGKSRALTFSYDDGVVQDRRLIGLMRENGLKGTFNLNSGFLGWKDELIRDGRVIDHSHIPAAEVAALYRDFEIAVHTVTHPDLCQLDDADVLNEVLADRRALEVLVDYPVRGMAYPFGTTDVRIHRLMAACGIRFSRGVRVTGDFSLPEDPLDWACSCHHYELEALIEPFLADGEDLRLLSVWGHAYEFDQKDQWALIEGQLKRLGGHDSVWYATNSQIFDYIAAFKALDCTLDGCVVRNTSALTLSFSRRGVRYRLAPGERIVFPEEKCEGNPQHPFRIWKDM